MAMIGLKQLRHSYAKTPSSDDDWAIKKIDLDWSDGGAYALLGPSGCGKSTLLNIISGLVLPTEGQVLFDGEDVTDRSPEQRNIAQVFQFPVIYDTMTVYNNLAFPLRNRGVDEAKVDARVREIAEMLELDGLLQRRASGLTADGKQKISMGRGLVRDDVNVIMFDEPLTVIDPHLKWTLRSKLKELHQKVGVTMIYVTHDQTEALTFADQVVVMQEGEVVQMGTPVDLFERPTSHLRRPFHRFARHERPALRRGQRQGDVQRCADRDRQWHRRHRRCQAAGNRGQAGIRRFAETGVPVEIVNVADAGRYRVVETRAERHRLHLLAREGEEIPGEQGHLAFDPARTRVYADGWLAEPARGAQA